MTDTEITEDRLLGDLLGILTVKEVELLTSVSLGDQRTSLSDVVLKQVYSNHEIENIKLKKEETEEELAEKGEDEAEAEEEFENEKVISLSKKRIAKKTYDEEEEEEEEEVIQDGNVLFKRRKIKKKKSIDTNIFILEEKERFKKSKKSLHKMDLQKTYQESANVELSKEDKAEKKKSSFQNKTSGLLINKRQS